MPSQSYNQTTTAEEVVFLHIYHRYVAYQSFHGTERGLVFYLNRLMITLKGQRVIGVVETGQ